MSRAKGSKRAGGRVKQDPNIVHKYTIPLAMQARPAALRKHRPGGKIPLSLDLPPEMYDQLRAEAIRTKRSLASIGLECLTAGLDIE